MQITLDIPEELLSQLSAIEQQIPEALKLGLQAIAARPQKGFAGFAEVVEFLANLPTAEEILALRPSAMLQSEIDRLSEKHQSQNLTPQEQELWQQYEYLEHVISMAKAKAYLRRKNTAAALRQLTSPSPANFVTSTKAAISPRSIPKLMKSRQSIIPGAIGGQSIFSLLQPPN
jgi:hypothetical protein